MVYCVQAWVLLPTAQRRDQMVSAVNSASAAKLSRWGITQALAVALEGSPGMTLVARFTSEAERDEVYLLANDQLTARGALPGSWVSRHDCGHDEDTPCANVEKVVVQSGGPGP